MDSQIKTLKTDNFSMDYFRFGQGEETFVILPGLSVQSVMGFADQVAEAYRVLADNYMVYMFDRRSDLPEKYYVHDMAEDTAEAMEVLGLEKVNLFGASQGGMIAMDMAVNHPEMVNKLVLGSTTAAVNDEQFRPIGKWIDLAKAGEGEGLYLAFGEEVYPEEVYKQSKELLTQAGKNVTDVEFERFVVLAEGMRGFDLTEDLGKIDCPVLVLGDKTDKVVGAAASEKIAELLKNKDCTLYMYNGYGHAAYDMAPDYKERILEFLK